MGDKAYDIVMENRKAIVEKLIEQMEQGYAPTRAAWCQAATGRPYNPISDAFYKGGNRLRLMIAAQEQGFSDTRWMTFQQATENNYRIAGGAKGVLLEKWIFYRDVERIGEDGEPVIGEDGKPEMVKEKLDHPKVHYFRVFNGEQVIGLPKLEPKILAEDYFSRTAEAFEKSSKCPIFYEQQDRAYYSPTEDKIHLPPKEAFKNNETRLSVLLHEMAHSTGHEARLNRPLGHKFGSVEYAKEELNAELSSVFLETQLNIAMDADSEMLKDHANYVKSWISILKDNPNELFIACAHAEGITDYLMENYEKELEQIKAMEQTLQTLEGRYTEAMRLLDYGRIYEDALVKDGSFAFKNLITGEQHTFESWHEVGEYLEERDISDMQESQKDSFEKLIHPKGRIEYFLTVFDEDNPGLNDATVKSYKNVEEALEAYHKESIFHKKMLSFSIQGERLVPWAEYIPANMRHVICRTAEGMEKGVPEATKSELEELKMHTKKILDALQRDNIRMDTINALVDMQYTAAGEIIRGMDKRAWSIRVVNDYKPQDYIEFAIKYDENMVTQRSRIVYGNQVVGEKSDAVKAEDVIQKGTDAFQKKDMSEWLDKQIKNMDISLDGARHLIPFVTYAEKGWETIEDHCELLENAGYDRNPSYPKELESVSENEQRDFYPYTYEHLEEIMKDITSSGFKATNELIDSVREFENLMQKPYTLRELAELHRQKPNFLGKVKEGFEKVVEECKKQQKEQQEKINEHQQDQIQGEGQEISVQKSSFMKQQMMAELQASPSA